MGLTRKRLEEVLNSIQTISPESVDLDTLPLSESLHHGRCRPPAAWPPIEHEAHEHPLGNELAGIK